MTKKGNNPTYPPYGLMCVVCWRRFYAPADYYTFCSRECRDVDSMPDAVRHGYVNTLRAEARSASQGAEGNRG